MKKLVMIMILLVGSLAGISQSIHFTNFSTNPTLLNPALTGYSNNCVRLGISTRQQWVNFPKYYRTYSVFTDTKVPFNKPKWIKNEDWIGLGFSV